MSIICSALCMFQLQLFAQSVTISDNSQAQADPSAMLEIKSDEKGLLIPRVELATDPIASPAKGLLVFNLSTSGGFEEGFYYWDGSQWAQAIGVDGPQGDPGPGIDLSSVEITNLGVLQITDDNNNTISTTQRAWLLGGNASTNPSNHFLGTTNSQHLAFRTNNTERMRIMNNGNVGIGTNSAEALFHVNTDDWEDKIRLTRGAAEWNFRISNPSDHRRLRIRGILKSQMMMVM